VIRADLVVRFGWMIWDRARPDLLYGGIARPSFRSFPSGHAAKTMSLKEAEHTALQRALEALHVLVSQVRRLWKVTPPSSFSEKSPSRTTMWKWKWALRAEPKRCRQVDGQIVTLSTRGPARLGQSAGPPPP
jgi:hypothetical protein